MTIHVHSDCNGDRNMMRQISDPAAYSIPDHIIQRVQAAHANIYRCTYCSMIWSDEIESGKILGYEKGLEFEEFLKA